MTYVSEQDTDSPLARWKFEETSGTLIDDDQSTTHDGTIVGAVTLNQPAMFGGAGLGADFDGSSGYVSFGNATDLMGIGTIEAVVLFDTIPASTANPIFTHAWVSGQMIPMAMGFNLDAAHAGKLQIGYFTGSVWVTATWSTAPQTGTPYHIVGKYDGTTLKLRVNGAEVASSTVGTARPATGSVNTAGYIGRRWDSAQYHNGRIWDVAVYATALSDARSDAHYTALANAFADNFANASAVFGGYSINSVDTTAWTTESGEPGGLFNTGWVVFTPSTNARYQLSTVGSSYDTVLNVYTGTALTSLTLVGSDDDSGGSGTSLLAVSLTGGTTYYIQAGAKVSGGGLLSFSITEMASAELVGITAEGLVDATPAQQLAGISAEALTNANGVPSRQLVAITVEVLVPAKFPFVGWGTPTNHRTWL